MIRGFDMTVEAARAKMAYLFSRNLSPEVIKENMQTDLQGELSKPFAVSNSDDHRGIGFTNTKPNI